MESNEIRAQLLEAERAAAAPFITYPKDPWWVVGLLSLVLPLMCVVLSQSEFSVLFMTVPTLCITAIILVTMSAQRQRRGTLPIGKAPRELKPMFTRYLLGTGIIAIIAISLGYLTPLAVSAPVTFVLSLGGLVWFGHAYEQAAARVRERLA